MKFKTQNVALVLCLTAIMAGCSKAPSDAPPLGEVEGVVTLDGAPVEGATIIFEPTTKGAASSGVTDSAGKYKLAYGSNSTGAAIGEHVVRITTMNADQPTEKLHPFYHARSKLKATVNEGKNTIDFPLEKAPKP